MSARSLILVGHTASRFGDQSWNFIVPLALVVVSHGSLWVASFYAICSRLVVLAIGSRLGVYMDTRARIQVVRMGAVCCVCSVTLVTCLLSYFLKWDTSSCFLQGNLVDWLFRESSCSWKQKCLFVSLSLVGSGEVVGAFLTRVSVERNWIIDIVEPDNLAYFNSLLRRIDLLSEITAPILVGWFASTNNNTSTLHAIVWVGLLNILSFLVEYGTLLAIHRSLVTSIPVTSSQDKIDEQQQDNFNPKTTTETASSDMLSGSFSVFLRHPLMLVVLAYSCLWFNATSPHGFLFTSYLAEEQHLSTSILGIFRASGALFGFLGTVVFPWWEKRWGLKSTCLFSILWETITLVVSCLLIMLGSEGWWSLSVSLSMIVLSRVGLYAFELGEALYIQRYTEASQRGRMGAVEGLLTNAANLSLLFAGLALRSAAQFRYLWISSAAFAALGCVLFIVCPHK